jgi:hypothetical protein
MAFKGYARILFSSPLAIILLMTFGGFLSLGFEAGMLIID